MRVYMVFRKNSFQRLTGYFKSPMECSKGLDGYVEVEGQTKEYVTAT
jgi:hypothetical protein